MPTACLSITLDETACYREIHPGLSFITVGAFDQNAMSVAMCKSGCNDIGNPLIKIAGITEGNLCLCGTDDPANLGTEIYLRNPNFFLQIRILHMLLT